jgi:HPt (histidine-containing phosphotransfer) domain-containing protein
LTVPDEPLFDEAVVDELRAATGDDEAFILDLVETYLSEGEGQLLGMAAAVEARDPAAIVRPAHTLKSSSASVGAMRLSAVCRGIEEAGREGRADGLAREVELARTTWAETVEALTAAGLAS